MGVDCMMVEIGENWSCVCGHEVALNRLTRRRLCRLETETVAVGDRSARHRGN